MTKRKVLRFLKVVMLYTLLMASVVTVGALYICYRAGEITGTVVTPLCGLWSIELGLGAYIKVAEGKTIKKNTKETDEEITV